jgi:hypothetical protein
MLALVRWRATARRRRPRRRHAPATGSRRRTDGQSRSAYC